MDLTFSESQSYYLKVDISGEENNHTQVSESQLLEFELTKFTQDAEVTKSISELEETTVENAGNAEETTAKDVGNAEENAVKNVENTKENA